MVCSFSPHYYYIYFYNRVKEWYRVCALECLWRSLSDCWWNVHHSYNTIKWRRRRRRSKKSFNECDRYLHRYNIAAHWPTKDIFNRIDLWTNRKHCLSVAVSPIRIARAAILLFSFIDQSWLACHRKLILDDAILWFAKIDVTLLWMINIIAANQHAPHSVFCYSLSLSLIRCHTIHPA